MGCKECKETKAYKQAGEVTAVITNYTSMFYDGLTNENFTVDVIIREDTVLNTDSGSDENIVYSKKNDINPMKNDEKVALANKISEKARKNRIYNVREQDEKFRISLNAEKLLVNIQRQLYKDFNENKE
ncbi:hypothetical protein SteCoe_26165 [Stentor coeruleus]|uniref:Uncharacterized protein n=1 Tax=Stentor coeruleus TaxID=5963 RepID=A0A1R2BDK9_9CILI|nr:hypothetical protein SteCoe_26165 [Stentor coeruleus]